VIDIVSRLSSKLMAGRIEGILLASIVLPEPGGPTISMLRKLPGKAVECASKLRKALT